MASKKVVKTEKRTSVTAKPKNSAIRTGSKRVSNRPDSPDELRQFIEWVLSKEGCSYVWPHKSNNYSGKDLKIAKYKNVYDCSGLVTAGLYHATKGRIDWRASKRAQTLFDQLEEIDSPRGRPCLAFYGNGKNMIEHVVVVLEDGRIIGANGGGSWCLTPEIAKLRGARVRFYPNHMYRSGFKGFRRIPL